MVIAAYGLQKSSNKARIFAAGRELDTAAHIHAEGRQGCQRAGNVVGTQPADDARRVGWGDVAFAGLPEDEAQQIGAGRQREARLGQRAHAAHFDERHAWMPRGAPATTRRRSCSPGSAALNRLSPTSTASAPTSMSLAICSGVDTPLSATKTHSAGTSGRRRGASETSVCSVSRSRLLTPIS